MNTAAIDINLNVTNNTDQPQQISVLGNPYNPLDTANARTQYNWDITALTFTTENSVTILYRLSTEANFETFTTTLGSQNVQGVVTALNTLGIGYFYSYELLGQTYISTYNDNYVFGELNIFTYSIIDSTFLYGTGFDAQTNTSYTLPNGKILIGGQFSNYNGTPANRIIQLNNDGSVNTSFIYGTGFNGDVSAIAIQNDGKILIGGAFSTYDGNAVNNLIRLNADGSLDNTFSAPAPAVGDVIFQIIVLSNGQILYGYNNVTIGFLVLLNSDGSVDFSFNIGLGFDAELFGIVIQSNGKLVVVGNYTNYDGSNVNGIVRLNMDGTIDNSFIQSFPLGSQSFAIAKFTNDSLIISTFDLTNYFIILLNEDGSINNNFTTGYLDSFAKTLVINPINSSIYCGGFFQNYSLSPSLSNPISSNRILQLSSNGNYNSNWEINTGFNSNVNNIGLNSNNGSILVTGAFTLFQTESANSIIRLLV